MHFIYIYIYMNTYKHKESDLAAQEFLLFLNWAFFSFFFSFVHASFFSVFPCPLLCCISFGNFLVLLPSLLTGQQNIWFQNLWHRPQTAWSSTLSQYGYAYHGVGRCFPWLDNRHLDGCQDTAGTTARWLVTGTGTSRMWTAMTTTTSMTAVSTTAEVNAASEMSTSGTTSGSVETREPLGCLLCLSAASAQTPVAWRSAESWLASHVCCLFQVKNTVLRPWQPAQVDHEWLHLYCDSLHALLPRTTVLAHMPQRFYLLFVYAGWTSNLRVRCWFGEHSTHWISASQHHIFALDHQETRTERKSSPPLGSSNRWDGSPGWLWTPCPMWLLFAVATASVSAALKSQNSLLAWTTSSFGLVARRGYRCHYVMYELFHYTEQRVRAFW